MIADHHTVTELERRPWAREALRWGAAALVVSAAHGAAAYSVMALAPVPEPQAMVEAMEIELTPLTVSTAEPVVEDAAAEELPEQMAEVADLPTEVEETVEEEQVDEVPDRQVEEPEQAEPLETATAETPDEVEPEPIPETPEAVVALPQPRPEIVEETVEVEKPKPKPKKPKAEKKPVVQTEKRPTQSRQSVAGASAPRAPSVSPDRWYAQVQAAIARRKPRSMGAAGRVSIRFVVNQSGDIVSYGIAGSSGDSRLDDAALGMVRGARVPAPPAGIASHSFTIPVSFEMR